VQDFIVVGVWNAGERRHPNYFPQKPYEQLEGTEKSFVTEKLKEVNRTQDDFTPNSDDYLKFLVHELKPHIDSTYKVHTDPNHTFIAGSSMGGLISWYALCEYPEIFGGAAAISTHWPGIFDSEGNPIPDSFIDYLRLNLPKDGAHKIYFDTGYQTLDAMYPDIQKKVDAMMQEIGFADKDWKSAFFPGADHSENAWKKRLDVPLRFLLQN